jgi:tetratricopeptide (TPR) repeat protein
MLYVRVSDPLGRANCVKRLGDLALEAADHARADERYREALALYQQVGSVLGQANCVNGLGDVALARADEDVARERWQEALALYARIREPYSIGWTHRRLARVAPTNEEQARHVAAAEDAWSGIERHDLIAELREELRARVASTPALA